MNIKEKLFIPLLLGTRRQGRKSELVARYILGKMQRHPKIETRLLDIKDMDLTGDEGTSLKDKNPHYHKAVNQADGLVIVVPEYNHSFPGSLKMTLDMLKEEYVHKAVGFCAVSTGGFGGSRVIESLLSVVRTLGLVPLAKDLNFSKVEELFNQEGVIIAADKDNYDKKVHIFLEELVWLSDTLRWGRNNLN